MQVWAVSAEINLHWLILNYISAFVLSQDARQLCLVSKHVYKNYSNVLIELCPDPGLV